MTEARNDRTPADVPVELADLAAGINCCSVDNQQTANKLDSAFRRVIDLVQRRKRILRLVQEALAQLRLDVKYLMFDLEVTRRERDELRSRLEEIERGY